MKATLFTNGLEHIHKQPPMLWIGEWPRGLNGRWGDVKSCIFKVFQNIICRYIYERNNPNSVLLVLHN